MFVDIDSEQLAVESLVMQTAYSFLFQFDKNRCITASSHCDLYKQVSLLVLTLREQF